MVDNKKKFHLITIAVCVCIILQLIPTTVLAASVSVSASSSAVSVGDTVKVNVTFKGDKLYGVQASFSYDNSFLKHVDQFGEIS